MRPFPAIIACLGRRVGKSFPPRVISQYAKTRQNYHDSTALLVYFDDYVAFAEPGDKPVVQEVLASTRNGWRKKFHHLFVVDASG